VSLSGFNTWLLAAKKVGKLLFFQESNEAHPEGRLLEADFIRAIPIVGGRALSIEKLDATPIMVVRFDSVVSFLEAETYQIQLLYRVSSSLTSITVDAGGSSPVTMADSFEPGVWQLAKSSLVMPAPTDQWVDVNVRDLPAGETVDMVLCVYSAEVDLGFVPPVADVQITRQEEDVEFTDLITKGVIHSSGFFSALFDVRSTYTVNSTFVRFWSGVDLSVGIINGPSGFRFWTDGDAPGTKGDIIDDELPFVLTSDGQSFKVYQNDALLVDYTRSPSVIIDRVDVVALTDSYKIEKMAFAPRVLTQSEAFNALNSI